jgi:hypothetical protein
MRYSAGPGVTFWWLRAVKYGVVDSELTPIFGMEIGNFSRSRATGPDSFAATSLEMVFFTDLATGERVDAITNPYTGERIPREDSLVGPTTIECTLDGAKYPVALPGAKFDGLNQGAGSKFRSFEVVGPAPDAARRISPGSH